MGYADGITGKIYGTLVLHYGGKNKELGSFAYLILRLSNLQTRPTGVSPFR
jgi:hypothetical protein